MSEQTYFKVCFVLFLFFVFLFCFSFSKLFVNVFTGVDILGYCLLFLLELALAGLR